MTRSGNGESKQPASGLDRTLPAVTETAPPPRSAGSGLDETLPAAGGSVPSGSTPSRPTATADAPPAAVGRYQIVREHARGGLGRVLRARDADLQREVALKELLQGSNVAEERFLREARITARLEHPAIVPVHELGLRDDGRPYYTMKLISGRALKDAITEAATLDQRLALIPHLQAVADAMAYAHARRIIHRDLKPANIICGEFGETVVIDWGLAKDLNDPSDRDDAAERAQLSPYRDSAPTQLTATGVVMGTPAYMPPEQARGEHVDERADVYALGAMLYHILGGAAPYSRTRGTSVVAEVLAGPPEPLLRFAPGAPPDLVAIAAKAMAREPGDRYPSAAELAVDLREYLTGGLVGARSYSTRELISRWLLRHRAIATASAVALVAVAGIGAVSVTRVMKERDRAETARATAERAREATERRNDELVLAHARSDLLRDPTESIAWLKTYGRNGSDWAAVQRTASDALSMGVARHVWDAHSGGAVHAIAVSPDGRTVVSQGRDDRLWLWNVETGTGIVAFSNRPWDGAQLSFAPDGAHVATGTNDGAILLVNSDGSGVRELVGHAGQVTFMEHSVDGRVLVSAGLDQTIRLWDIAAGTGRVVATLESPVFMVRLSPDGTRALSCDGSLSLELIDVATGSRRKLGTCEKFEVEAAPLAFSPDGQWVAASDGHGNVTMWPSSGGASRTIRGAPGRVHDLEFSSDGKLLAGAHSTGSAFVWSAATGATVLELPGCPYQVELSRDGELVACGGKTGEILLHDLVRGGQWTLRGDTASVRGLEFSPQGEFLASGGLTGLVRVWPLPTHRPRAFGPIEDTVFDMRYSPDGRWIATVDRSGALSVADTSTGELRALHVFPVAIVTLAFVGGDSPAIAVADWRGGIHLWDVATSQTRTLGAHAASAIALAVTPDGRYLLSAAFDGEIRSWDIRTGEMRVLGQHDGPARAVVVSPDGATAASGGADGVVRVWSLTGAPPRAFEGHEALIGTVWFSPAGDSLLSTSWDGTARVWDIATGSSRVVARHDGAVRAGAWLPDGAHVLTGGADGALMLADPSGAEPPVRLLGHSKDILTLDVTRDGRIAVSASKDGTARVWWLDDGRSAVLRGRGLNLETAVFSPDGSHVAAAGFDPVVLEWPVPAAPTRHDDPAELIRELEAATTSQIVAGGNGHRTPQSP